MKGYEISFSPTGGTQRAAGILAERLLDAIVPVDLTDGREDFSSISLGKGDVAVIAVPSYGGRAPGYSGAAAFRYKREWSKRDFGLRLWQSGL